MSARLIWERNGGRAVEFTLTDITTVGREEDADIQIQEPLVSRMHARIERRGEAWFVLDLGSTNLTRVNGDVVRERELVSGDELQFGRARCRFREGARAPDAPPGPEAAAREASPSEPAHAETPRPMPAPPEET